MWRGMSLATPIAALALMLAGSASAARPLTTLTFDELEQQPVDGLTFGGVTFGFEIGGASSEDAFYNRLGPGTLTFVDDPSLEGNSSGTLTLTFEEPTTTLSFGVARLCVCTMTPGVSVELFRSGPDGATTTSTTTLTTESLVEFGFSEALFSYKGPKITKAVITFPEPETAPRFVVDNLTFWSKA